ncbi:MAG: cyclic pyranopterin monophosphate synthase MoaC [Spirochaetia bacterium]
MEFSHIDEQGKARMVDVSGKPKVRRTARAAGFIRLAPKTLELIQNNRIEKGEVLSTARIAGITGGKRTSDLIPLCHGIGIDSISVDFHVVENGIEITSSAVCVDKTGIEMEALTAVSIAALTVYDMCKAVDKEMEITDIRLVEKTKEQLQKEKI